MDNKDRSYRVYSPEPKVGTAQSKKQLSQSAARIYSEAKQELAQNGQGSIAYPSVVNK